jgi:hypothetical protein
MAENTAAVTEVKKTRKRREGPAPTRPAYLIHKIVDADGTPIAGANLQIEKATRKSDEILAALDNDRTLSYSKFDL